MIAAVMLYALTVGLLLAAVGVMSERTAALRRLPRRWIWAALLVATMSLSAAAPWRGAVARDTSAVVLEGALITDTARIATEPARWARVGDRVSELVTATVTAAARFDLFLAGVWLGASSVIGIILITGHAAIARRRRTWHEAVVDSEPVLIAPATGPAVVGLASPRIVLPTWVLDLDAPSIQLILRHEREHVRAGDPWLIHLAGAAVLLMPWNPAAWWMASRLRLAVELDCDARVIGDVDAAGGSDAAAYGELLLAVAEQRPRRNLLAAPALVESSSSLARRISALFPDVVRFTAAKVAGTTCGALALAALVVMVPMPRVAAMPAIETSAASAVGLTPTSSFELAPSLTPDSAPRSMAPSEAAITQSVPAESRQVVAPARAFDAATAAPLNSSTDLAPAPSIASAPTAALETPPLLASASTTAPISNVLGPASLLEAPASPSAELAPARRSVYPGSTPGLVAPELVRATRPLYTIAAMRERIFGNVTVEAIVGTDGRVDDARIIESLDKEYGLDQAAIVAAKDSIFRPGSLNGTPVPVAVTMELSFQIY